MKTGTIFALTFIASLLLVFAQGTDEENAVLQTERELCAAYLKGDADAIAQGVMEDYTLTNSTGKITMRADDINEAKRNRYRPNTYEGNLWRESFRFAVSVHGYIRQRWRALAFTGRPCFKAAAERKIKK